MAYETRRSRRLRLEQEARRRKRQRVIAFLIATVFLAGFSGIAIYIGRQNLGDVVSPATTSNPSAPADPTATAEVELPQPSAGEVIASDLPAKLTEIDQELGIGDQSNLSDLPDHTVTAVAMADLSDNNRGEVRYNDDVQFTSASTYKLYVAYAMIHDVETGRRNWSSPINGTTWDTCLSRMIINSDNACPETYLASIGYSRFNDIVHGIGASERTHFQLYDMRTTGGDLLNFLQKLYRGELMSDDNKNKLFDLMSRQVYRQGIPSGIGETGSVYDKVGFMDGLLHDAGIVVSDSGDYALVILTNGESWEYIARVANYINGVMTSQT